MTRRLVPFVFFFAAYFAGAPLVLLSGVAALVSRGIHHREAAVVTAAFFFAAAGHAVAYRDTLPLVETHGVAYADREVIRLEGGGTFRHDGTTVPREGDEIRFDESAVLHDGKSRFITSFEVVPPRKLRSRLALFIQEQSGSHLLLAFATGKRLFTPAERAAFLKTGTMHLVAISAFHIGILFLLLHGFTRLFFLFQTIPPRTIAYLSTFLKALLLFWYLSLTGWATPTVRAALFVMVLDTLLSFGLTIHPTQAFLWSLVLTGIVLPRSITSWSFVMSALSVCAVISLWLRLPRSSFVSLLALSVLINFLFIPISAELTGWVPLIAPLANLLTVPLATVLLVFLIPAQIVFPLFPSLAKLLLVPSDGLARVMTENLFYLSSLSDGTLLPLRQATGVWTALFYLVAATILFGTGALRRSAAVILVVCAIPFFVPSGADHGLETISAFPGEAYCVREGRGRGRIVEVRRYNFPADHIQRKIDLLPVSLERDLAACGILQVTGFHLRAPLPRSLIAELHRRPRFRDSKIFLIDSSVEIFSDTVFPLTFLPHSDTVP